MLNMLKMGKSSQNTLDSCGCESEEGYVLVADDHMCQRDMCCSHMQGLEAVAEV